MSDPHPLALLNNPSSRKHSWGNVHAQRATDERWDHHDPFGVRIEGLDLLPLARAGRHGGDVSHNADVSLIRGYPGHYVLDKHKRHLGFQKFQPSIQGASESPI